MEGSNKANWFAFDSPVFGLVVTRIWAVGRQRCWHYWTVGSDAGEARRFSMRDDGGMAGMTWFISTCGGSTASHARRKWTARHGRVMPCYAAKRLEVLHPSGLCVLLSHACVYLWSTWLHASVSSGVSTGGMFVHMVAPARGANIFVFHVPINWTDDDFNAHFTPCGRQITGWSKLQPFLEHKHSHAWPWRMNFLDVFLVDMVSELVPGLDRLFLQRFTWIQWPRCMISASAIITRACFEDIPYYLMNFSVNIETWGIQRLWLLFLCHNTSCYNGYQRNEWSCT